LTEYFYGDRFQVVSLQAGNIRMLVARILVADVFDVKKYHNQAGVEIVKKNFYSELTKNIFLPNKKPAHIFL
jgi:hypothetical protein